MIIKPVKTVNSAYEIGNNTIKNMLHADDADITAKKEDVLQWLLYKLRSTSEELNMKIYIKKKKT